LLDERAYVEEIASDNAKNYQLWNHRRKCAMAIGEEGKHEEMKFTADVYTPSTPPSPTIAPRLSRTHHP
jgi:hypothetical protein